MKHLSNTGKALLWSCLCYISMTSTYAQSAMNTYTADNGQPVIIGKSPRASLLQQPFRVWYQYQYQQYKPDSIILLGLKEQQHQYTMQIFLGTWCGDSRREVPRMLKVLDSCGWDATRLELIFVDGRPEHYKQSPQHEEAGKNILRVPTFIIRKGEKEVGRIIETPTISLEADLWKIIREGSIP